jgi:zinc/manganese transport system substrate-binding protein
MTHRTVSRFAALAAAAFIGLGAASASKLRVVATTPDLASITREIGGDAVDVAALAKPTEDPHFVDAKPSFIVTLNRADVLVEGGAELELGWLPPLMENSRNTKIAAGAPGHIVASEGIRMLEIPTTFDRSKGDIHSKGNPHYLTDPMNAKIVAANIATHLAQVDPANAATYKANLAKFNTRIDAKLAQWKQLLAPYAGAKIVTYHKDFPYFAERFGLDVVENLEPKPGISPSPSHLAEVIQAMKTNHAHVILVQPFQNQRTAETVARQTAGRVLLVPQQPGAIAADSTYFDMMDYMVTTMANALAGK